MDKETYTYKDTVSYKEESLETRRLIDAIVEEAVSIGFSEMFYVRRDRNYLFFEAMIDAEVELWADIKEENGVKNIKVFSEYLGYSGSALEFELKL